MALKFRTLGRSSQALVQSPEDLADVLDLEDGLWAASAVTIDTLRLDKGFLGLVDGHGDGRVRSDEVRTAIKWLRATLKDRSRATGGVTTLALAALADDGDGPKVRDAANRVLGLVGATGAAEITLDQVRKARADEEAKGLSAAGKALPAAAGDDKALEGFLTHVIEVTGGEPHPAGGAAVTAATLDAFLAQGKDWLAWHDAAPEDTSALLGAHRAVADKLAQYFLLCDAVHLDADLAKRAWIDAGGTDLLDTAAATALLEKAPLSRPRPDGVLDTKTGLNPAWRARVEAWLASASAAGLDMGKVDRALVAAVGAKVAPRADWEAKKPATKAGDRGKDALLAHVSDASFAARTRDLLTKSEAAAVALDGIKLVEKAVLYQAWLLPLVNTMVALPDLYDTDKPGWCEHGTLVIDGRVFDLAFKVNDVARAERFAAMSPIFTMFVKVGEKGGTLDEEYMVPVTAGERGHLVDGMWGVFFDVEGKERHAQIRKMIANPISISEALWAPFRKIGDTIQAQLDKAAASQTDAMSTTVTSKAASVADTAASAPTAIVAAGEAAKVAPPAPPPAAAPAPAAPPAPAPAASPLGGLPVLLAGGGIALGAIGTFLTTALAEVFGATAVVSAGIGDLARSAINAVSAGSGVAGDAATAATETATSVVAAVSYPFALVLVLLGVVLVPFSIYAVPVALATWFRLRRRDLATLLEASGWAMNTRLFLDRKLAAQLTRTPAKPK